MKGNRLDAEYRTLARFTPGEFITLMKLRARAFEASKALKAHPEVKELREAMDQAILDYSYVLWTTRKFKA